MSASKHMSIPIIYSKYMSMTYLPFPFPFNLSRVKIERCIFLEAH